jgi:hypothetical protein
MNEIMILHKHLIERELNVPSPYLSQGEREMKCYPVSIFPIHCIRKERYKQVL